ncbi:HEAT repeat-containing protein 6 [Asbolus verrucosus]|uniref:HEAT repeat-containing protein 6 n=1 Tax=Asbolus verrucosus TaxID=1661398 RepID=A0A482VUF5_ASBVE|nr:HEAT repeat-containing protein 6 [Asbolus verrucosus]
MAARNDSPELFNNLSSKITQLLYGRTKNDRSIINKTLDELNSFNYKYAIVTNPTKAVLLVNQCCSLIPPEDLELVLKCCQLITNLITRQSVLIEGRTLTVAVQWCLQALKEQNSDADILIALDALLRTNTKHDLISEVVKNTPLTNLAKKRASPETALFSLQCLEACTFPPEDPRHLNPVKFTTEFQICFDIFLGRLVENSPDADKLINVKIRTVCLRGLQNIIMQKHELLHDNLGIILGVIKTYMLFGISGVEFVIPQKLMPSALSVPEPSTNMTREKKGGKMTKQRKHRTQASTNKVKKNEDWNDNPGYTPALMNTSTEEGYSGFGNRLKTSDSDFSDTEGGNAAKLSIMSGRLTEKSVVFSYWSSFIPENSLSARHNLTTCILKDTSARGRMAALNVLLALLTSCKLYLTQAEKGENLAFTPFCVIIGLMIKELHKCLSLALNENSIPVLTQILKCFAALIQATPYHRLARGLITKVIRNVKPFIYHKDQTVQVTALIALGCTLASEPLIPETKDAFIKHIDQTKPQTKKQTSGNSDDFDFAEFSSDEEEIMSDNTDVPWLLERCLLNLGVKLDCDRIAENAVSTPVKLESLQIISVMSQNYFETLLAPHLNLITRALDAALSNKYSDVRLHAGRAVDFIGQAMNKYFSGEGEKVMFLDQCLPFWQVLLNGSLTGLLQSEQHPILRAVGCDCLGSMGAFAFEQLPRDKQILCVTLLFACSRDDENSVKGAAVRALAICVLYPSLREDAGFVVDTAETIHRVLQEENLTVKVKCSWSLGNLSEALVLNRTNPDPTEELPNSLIFKLLKATIKASHDNDKIKMNTVRALGNILQLINEDLIEEANFKEAIEEGIDILVKTSTSGSNMKVRWNSCYAIGNAMKNPVLFATTINWQEKVFNALIDLVMNFRNFKVRINAAVALASPKKREFYKQFFHPVWMALTKGLETAQNMEDFNEYKHRDHLVEQICLSLGHLLTLLTKEDLAPLKDSVHSDQLKLQMRRVWERLLPEKSTILFDAHIYVTKMGNDPDLSSEQKNVLKYLDEMLTQKF